MTEEGLIRLDYCMFHYKGTSLYAGKAWNLEKRIMIMTGLHDSYSAARASLSDLVDAQGCTPFYFQGEYYIGPEGFEVKHLAPKST